MERSAWVPPGVDAGRPSIARVYDAHLGGSDNVAVDREVAAQMARMKPDLPEVLRANRSFPRRAIRYRVGTAGITQLLDLGAGIPTVGNVHVDIDRVAVAHSRHLLTGNALAAVLHADLRDPDRVLADPVVTELLDFSRPIAVLAVSVLRFLSDADEPAAAIRRYLDAAAPGSYLAITHGSADTPSAPVDDRTTATAAMYSSRVSDFHLRDRDRIAAFFTGPRMIDPGLVRLTEWWPDTEAEAADPNGYAGVAIKP